MSQAEVFTATNSYWVCLRLTLTWFSEMMWLLLVFLLYPSVCCPIWTLVFDADVEFNPYPDKNKQPDQTISEIHLQSSHKIHTVTSAWQLQLCWNSNDQMDRLRTEPSSLVPETNQPQLAALAEWPSSLAVVIFHRGQQLRMWSTQRLKHAVLAPPKPSFLYHYHFIPFFLLQSIPWSLLTWNK